MISHRGARYAIGQGPQFYGIWDVTAPHSQPLEWWHKTPEGWAAAWTRFASIEAPGTITAVTQPPAAAAAPAAAVSTVSAGRRPLVAAVLLTVGVILGVVGLFPDYVAGTSLAQQAANLVPHAIYLAVWTASAILIIFGAARLRAGALLATGLSAVTFGLFLADVGTPIADGWHAAGAGLGLVLSLLGWLACAAGSVVALRLGPASRLGRPAGHDTVPLVMIIVAAIGTVIAFAPSWDSYALSTATGISQTITEGNAFANPALVIAGNVVVMLAVVAVISVAACWRPIRLGAALAAGAIVPMLAQLISALILVREPVSPAQFGLSPAQAAGVGLTIHAGLTAIFWVFCAFVAILILLCGWMLVAPDAALPAAGQRLPAGAEGASYAYPATSAASFGQVTQMTGAGQNPASGASPAPSR